MYVGPWQEYKLMKVIADMQNERDRLQEEMENMSCYPEEYLVNKHDVSDDYINSSNRYDMNNDEVNLSIQESLPYSVSEGVNYHSRYEPELRVVHRHNVDGLLVHLDRRQQNDIVQHSFDTYPPGHYCAPGYKHLTQPSSSQRAMRYDRGLSSSSTTPESCTRQHNLTREERAVLALLPQPPINESNVCVKAPLDLDTIARLASQKVFEERVRGPVQRGVFYVAPHQTINSMHKSEVFQQPSSTSSAFYNSSLVSSSSSESSMKKYGSRQYCNSNNYLSKSNSSNAMQNVNLQKLAMCNAKNKMQEKIERRRKLQALYTSEMESEDREVEHIANCTTGNSNYSCIDSCSINYNERPNDIVSDNVLVVNNKPNINIESNEKYRDVHELEQDEVEELMTWADMLNIDEIEAMESKVL